MASGGSSPKRRGAAVEREIARYLGGTRFAGSSSSPGRAGCDLNIPDTLLWVDVKARNPEKVQRNYAWLFTAVDYKSDMDLSRPFVMHATALGVAVFHISAVARLTTGRMPVTGIDPTKFSWMPLGWLSNIKKSCPEGNYPALALHLFRRRYEKALIMMRWSDYLAWTSQFKRVQ